MSSIIGLGQRITPTNRLRPAAARPYVRYGQYTTDDIVSFTRILTSVRFVTIPGAMNAERKDTVVILDRSGLYRIEYEDVLRAVGNYLDVNLFRSVTLFETPDGFLIKGITAERAFRASGLAPQTLLFTNADLEASYEAAYARRGEGRGASDWRPEAPLRYEDLLRVIGRRIDAERWHDIVIMQTPSGTRLKALAHPDPSAASSDQVVEVLFRDDEVRELITELRAGRKPRKARRFWPV
jgi:hypothetical protein